VGFIEIIVGFFRWPARCCQIHIE